MNGFIAFVVGIIVAFGLGLFCAIAGFRQKNWGVAILATIVSATALCAILYGGLVMWALSTGHCSPCL